MTALGNRLKRLEGAHSDEGIIVYITRLSRADEDQEAKRITYGDHTIKRLEGETEGAFIDRAHSEVRGLVDPSNKLAVALTWLNYE